MSTMLKILLIFICLLTALFLYSYKTNHGRGIWYPYVARLYKESLNSRLDQFSDPVKDRLLKDFESKGISYPPKKMSFVALKQEKRFELWCANSKEDRFTFIKSYNFTGFSGVIGPKLQEGDRQIPEGFYKIKSLNPNSSYHLSLEVNYPNSFDLKHAKNEGRANPGSLIYIHGKNVTIGCIPLGDQAIEEIFVLSALVQLKNIDLIISPKDFRLDSSFSDLSLDKNWLEQLYKELSSVLKSKYVKK
ncbi:MAG: L,D-transpeptidase family protein [Candidatus Cloacimonetes bacterium]|nr:L,D-transpeptidase family protein [Candidatus Cloacimonadota bacterium]